MEKTILKKLQEARELIKHSDLKKSGRNTYSDYDYYTPEQVNKLVHDAEQKTGLIHIFNLIRSEFGITGYLKIIDIESGNEIEFIQASDIPKITATNIAQQIGGAVTYTNRYMLMTAFDIVDNNLDFDAKDNRKKQSKNDDKQWLNPGTDKWKAAVSYLKEDGNTISDIQKKYKISKINIEKLKNEVL